MTLTITPARRAYVPPGLGEIQRLQDQIQALQARVVAIGDQILSDAAFMDTPVMRIPVCWLSRPEDAQRGDVWHLHSDEWEDGSFCTVAGHLASRCRAVSDACCRLPVGTSKPLPHSRRPRRVWRTTRGSWVMVTPPDADGLAGFVATEDAA